MRKWGLCFFLLLLLAATLGLYEAIRFWLVGAHGDNQWIVVIDYRGHFAWGPYLDGVLFFSSAFVVFVGWVGLSILVYRVFRRQKKQEK